jgi:hypothetical protein
MLLSPLLILLFLTDSRSYVKRDAEGSVHKPVLIFWVVTPCGHVGDANVLEKHTASKHSLTRFIGHLAGVKAFEVEETLVSEVTKEASCFSVTLVYESARRNNPEDRHRRLHRRENIKSHFVQMCVSLIKELEVGQLLEWPGTQLPFCM